MRHIRLSVTAGLIAMAYTTLAQQPPAPPAPMPAALQNYQPVTAGGNSQQHPAFWRRLLHS